MSAKFSKCEFWLAEVGFLGHMVSTSGVSVDPGKVEVVMSWERPKSVFEIRSDKTRPGYPPRIPRVVPPSEVPLYNPWGTSNGTPL